jgi:hypothetical protein
VRTESGAVTARSGCIGTSYPRTAEVILSRPVDAAFLCGPFIVSPRSCHTGETIQHHRNDQGSLLLVRADNSNQHVSSRGGLSLPAGLGASQIARQLARSLPCLDYQASELLDFQIPSTYKQIVTDEEPPCLHMCMNAALGFALMWSMRDRTKDPSYWRDRAKATRAKAKLLRYNVRELQRMLRVAEEYDKLAERAAEWQRTRRGEDNAPSSANPIKSHIGLRTDTG